MSSPPSNARGRGQRRGGRWNGAQQNNQSQRRRQAPVQPYEQPSNGMTLQQTQFAQPSHVDRRAPAYWVNTTSQYTHREQKLDQRGGHRGQQNDSSFAGGPRSSVVPTPAELNSNWRRGGIQGAPIRQIHPISAFNPQPSSSAAVVPAQSSRFSEIQRGSVRQSRPIPAFNPLLDGIATSPLETIVVSDHDMDDRESAAAAAKVVDVKYVASYVLTDAEIPTIKAPGSPPVLKGSLKPPLTLGVGHGSNDLPTNPVHCALKKQPLVPLFEAIHAIGPSENLNWPDIDFVIDHADLMHLLRWAVNSKTVKDFRMDIEVAGDSSALVNTYMQGAHKTGLSSDDKFAKLATVPARGCGDSVAYYRAISYDFFGLKLLVQHKADACLSKFGKTGITAYETGSTPLSPDAANIWEDDNNTSAWDVDLDQTCSSNSSASGYFSGSVSPAENSLSGAVAVQHVGGKPIPQNGIVQLNISHPGGPRIGETLTGAYLAGVFLVRIGELGGTGNEVGEIKEIDMRQWGVRDLWKTYADSGLVKLGCALEAIQAAIRTHQGKKRTSLVCEHGVLRLYARSNEEDQCLPSEVLGWFEQTDEDWFDQTDNNW